MEDGRPRRLGQLRTMQTRTCFDGRSREADLVVSDEMYGSTHSVIMEVAHLHGFIDDALPGEGSITMNSNAKGLAPRLVVHVVLLSTHSTSDDGVDEFQVRGVGQQVDADFLAAGVDLFSEGAQVVLHISRITPLLLIRLCTLALELIKDILEWLPHHICQHIQTASVWHAHGDMFDTVVDADVDGGFDAWD